MCNFTKEFFNDLDYIDCHLQEILSGATVTPSTYNKINDKLNKLSKVELFSVWAKSWTELFRRSNQIYVTGRPRIVLTLIRKILEEIQFVKSELPKQIKEKNLTNRFIKLHFKGLESCSSQFSIPSKEILIFYKLLRQKGLEIPENSFQTHITDMLFQTQLKYIKNYFMNRSPQFYNISSWKSFAKTYYSLFGDTMVFLNIAFKVASEDLRLETITYDEFAIIVESTKHDWEIENELQALDYALNALKIDRSHLETIDCMSGIEFERFLQKLFEQRGFLVELTSVSGDQGGDLVLTRNGTRTLVQAKRYSGSVSNEAVQQVVAALPLYNCTNSMVITNSYFTKSATELAKANNVRLWNRDTLESALLDFNL